MFFFPDEPSAQGVPDLRRCGRGRALSAGPGSTTLPPRAGLRGIKDLMFGVYSIIKRSSLSTNKTNYEKHTDSNRRKTLTCGSVMHDETGWKQPRV